MTLGDNHSESLFPIVGIGASAGGLYSLECFLAALPKEFAFALVFIQHLSPKHRSLLPELLHARRPDLEINEITDGLGLLPGRLYLCPPGKEVRIQKRTFHLSPPSEDHVHLPIDEFFVSLSEEEGERAIGVIFSGAGTDGARGTQAIRSMGGTVFVQDPSTAEFPGMPLAAISTGQADGVLSPEDITREILKMQVAGAVSMGPADLIAPKEFETFYRLLHEKTGHRFNHYKKIVVGRRIRRRMYLHGVISVTDYMKMVAEKDSEAALLADDLMIGVTSFFRDRLAWKALKIEVIRRLAAEDDDGPIRVWSPACATGEEAYSITMMLSHELDLSGRKREIQVFATDVNDRALEKAREGKYPGSIAADVEPDYMKKFFACSEDGLSVIIGKELRERVVFAKQDLLTDPPFSRLDLVICRNFLIYLEPEAQEKCIALFHYALKNGGFLFLGNAESPGRNSTLFKSLGHKKCRVYRKIETKLSARLPLTVPLAAERIASLPSVRAVEEHQQSVTEFIQEILIEEYAPAAVAINQNCEILYHNGPTNRYLRQPRGAPTQNLLDLLPENLRNRLRGALYRAADEVRAVSVRASIPGDDESKRQVTLRISKMREDLFLIIFREKGCFQEEEDAVPLESAAVEETAVRQLESELSATRAELQSHIEQLKSLNEELQSSNEELQAANEELETSREELQSLNEELITVNSQLQGKIEEQEETNNDLNNFLASTNIPTVFLDHQFRVKRFTPAMSKLIKLIPGDIGRPIMDMSQENLGPDLITDAQEVLDHLAPVKKEIVINDVWYVRATLPYRTSDNRIEGVIVTYSDVTELKRAEECSRHLATFPQMNPNPICEVDSSGNVTFCNPATERVLESLGMDKGDVAVFLPPDLHSIFGSWDKENEASLYRELAIKDRVFAVNIYLSPHFNVARIYAFDITERKRAEEALAENRERLSLALISTGMATFEWDMIKNKRTWDDTVHRLLGTKPETFTGTAEEFFQIIHPEDRNTVQGALSKALETTAAYETEYRAVWPDGSIHYIAARGKVHRDNTGRADRMTGICWDITERKQAEQALQESEERLRLFIEHAPASLAMFDRQMRYLSVSRRWLSDYGLGDRDLRGMSHYEIFPEVPDHWKEVHRRGLAGEVIRADEDRFDRPDGTAQWLQWEVRPWFDAAGAVGGIVIFTEDITKRKKAEEELRAVNKELTRFNSAAVGRELRMIELKKEVNDLLGRAGLPSRYPLDFEKEG